MVAVPGVVPAGHVHFVLTCKDGLPRAEGRGINMLPWPFLGVQDPGGGPCGALEEAVSVG